MRRKLLSLLLVLTFLPPFQAFSQESQKPLNVTATVPAQPSDFTTETELIDPSPASSYPQDTVLTYQITYGSALSNSVNMTLEAHWSLGTIDGSGTPTVEIVDYVVGSASNAYGSTPPVIDPVNRKITWTIATFPQNTTDQTVTFQLKTNSNYTGNVTVDFDTSSLIHGPGVDSVPSSITTTYLYAPAPSPTPTPTSASAPTSTPGASTPTPTATPTPSATPFSFGTINVNEKSSTTVTIAVTTNQTARVTIFYGTGPTALTSSATSVGFNSSNSIKLEDLKPDTIYYFRARAINTNGNVINSDIYTFKTAIESELPTINLETLIATSQDKVILDGALAQNLGSSTIIIPKDFTNEIRFAVNRDAPLKRIVLNVRPKNVLGINTFTKIEPPETGSTLIEIQEGLYYGRLKAGQVGLFELIARIEDENGNIVEQKVADIRVLELMKIVNSSSKQPIGGARVSLSFFNLQNNQFELISSASLAIKSPSYSGVDGAVSVVLPPGRYQAKVETLGYKTQTVAFEIGMGDKEKYPLILLERGPLTIPGIISFIANTITDMFNRGREIFGTFSLSPRLALLLHGLTVFLFIILLILSIALHFSVLPFLLPQYILYHSMGFLGKQTQKGPILQGVVVNKEDGYGVKGIFVYIHAGKNKILAHTTTNSFGEFYVKVPQASSYQITTMHPSFKPSEPYVIELKEADKPIKAHIEERRHNVISKFLHQAGWYGGYVLSDIIELLLVTTLLLEILFMLNLGINTTIPFTIIAFLNLLLLLYFRKHKEEAKISVN